MLIFLQFEHEQGSADNFENKERHLKNHCFFLTYFKISKQDKLVTLKNIGE